MTEPRTLAEHLDAASTPDQFASVLQGLFGVLEQAIDEEEQ